MTIYNEAVANRLWFQYVSCKRLLLLWICIKKKQQKLELEKITVTLDIEYIITYNRVKLTHEFKHIWTVILG